MFCPELIPSLSFTPVAAGVIFIPDLIVLQFLILHTRPKNRIFTPPQKGVSRSVPKFERERIRN
jgi:hypothetical protein